MSNQAEWRKYHEKTKDWDAVYIFEGSELICHAANEEAADELMALHTAARVGRDLASQIMELRNAGAIHFQNEALRLTRSALDAMSPGGKTDGA